MMEFFGDLQDLYEPTTIFELLSKLILWMTTLFAYQTDMPHNLGIPLQVEVNLLPDPFFSIYKRALWWKWPNHLCQVSTTVGWLGKASCSSSIGFREKLFPCILILNISRPFGSMIRQALSSKNNLNPFSRSYPRLNKFWSIFGTNKTLEISFYLYNSE